MSVGSEIISYCGACKMDLAHTIVAYNGASPVTGIAKVQCKTCKATHRFRQAKGVKTPQKGTSRTKEPKVTVEDEWQKQMSLANKETKPTPYSPTTKFLPGYVVDHPTFGKGVVIKFTGPKKMEVIFQNDIKLLAGLQDSVVE